MRYVAITKNQVGVGCLKDGDGNYFQILTPGSFRNISLETLRRLLLLQSQQPLMPPQKFATWKEAEAYLDIIEPNPLSDFQREAFFRALITTAPQETLSQVLDILIGMGFDPEHQMLVDALKQYQPKLEALQEKFDSLEEVWDAKGG